MSTTVIECYPADAPCQCADCDWTGPATSCQPIADLEQRIAAGETVPAGECPECGCLAHPVATRKTFVPAVYVHGYGVDVLGGYRTNAAATARLARYCRDNWHRVGGNQPQDDTQCVAVYFDASDDHGTVDEITENA